MSDINNGCQFCEQLVTEINYIRDVEIKHLEGKASETGTGTELVVDRDSKKILSFNGGVEITEHRLKHIKCNNCINGMIERDYCTCLYDCPNCNGTGYFAPFPELKFKNGDFER